MTAPWCQPRARPLGEARPLGRGGLQQLPGVGARAVGVLHAGEHAGQLALAAGVVERRQPGRGDRRRRWTCAPPRGGRRTPPPAAGGSPPAPATYVPARPAGGRPRPRPCRPRRRRPRRTRTSAPGRCRPGTTSSASITRDSSPPEAPLCSGRASAPVLAASRNSTSSTPCGRNAASGRRPAAAAGRRLRRRRLLLGHRHGDRGVRHGQGGQLVGDRSAEPLGGGVTLAR